MSKVRSGSSDKNGNNTTRDTTTATTEEEENFNYKCDECMIIYDNANIKYFCENCK